MTKSGKTRILEHLKKNIGKWISNGELRNIAGYKGNDVPRVIRSLRQEGWAIEVRGDGYNRLTSFKKGPGRGLRKPISEKIRYQVLERDGHRCKSCGRSPEDNVKLQIDHVIPVDWGGKTEIDNLETLCEECNRGKKNWIPTVSVDVMQKIMLKQTVEERIEALFESLPCEDIPSAIIRLVSRGAFDWQRALRRIRQRTGKKIVPTQKRTAYRYDKH
jgi:5-methylcytosine-specific restriction endonuclease McrA